jgi:hypothetical protein
MQAFYMPVTKCYHEASQKTVIHAAKHIWQDHIFSTGTEFMLLYQTLFMADNPNKKKADGKRISQQPHEQAYQKRKTAKGKSAKQAKKK